jgi:hypothetical protein
MQKASLDDPSFNDRNAFKSLISSHLPCLARFGHRVAVVIVKRTGRYQGEGSGDMRAKRFSILNAIGTILLVLFIKNPSGFAQETATQDQQPGVARASLIQGSVSLQRGDNSEWEALAPNTPLMSGDSIAAGPGTRAEIQLDFANIIRLSAGANVRIANLTPSNIQLQVSDGLVGYSMIRPSEAAVEIDTPNAAIHPLGPGNYRMLITQSGEVQVTSWNNSADIVTSQSSTRIGRQQSAFISGMNVSQIETFGASSTDDWDRWNADRDRLILTADSWKHTNQYYEGSADLDAYGRWSSIPDYGNVWMPAVAPGWAPYRDGRWVWQTYYGWTWVASEPWGWAPYHYGRWFVYRGAWAWWPGQLGSQPFNRPRWAPAYVSFFGFGVGQAGSVGIGVSFGNVGWLPVGPVDPFFPWYGRNAGRVNYFNIGSLANYNGGRFGGVPPLAHAGMYPYSNFREAERNENIRRGASFMAANEFGRGRVPMGQRSIDSAEISRAGWMAGGLPMTPGRQSFRSKDQPASREYQPSGSRSSRPMFSDGQWSRSTQIPAGQASQGYRPAPEQSWRTARPQTPYNASPSRPPMPMTDRVSPESQHGNVNAPPNGWRQYDRGGMRTPGQPGNGRPERSQQFNQPSAPQQYEQGRRGGDRQGNPTFNRNQPGPAQAPPVAPQAERPRSFFGGQSTDRPSRPQLDLGQPIVRQRSQPSDAGRSRGGEGRAPSDRSRERGR